MVFDKKIHKNFYPRMFKIFIERKFEIGIRYSQIGVNMDSNPLMSIVFSFTYFRFIIGYFEIFLDEEIPYTFNDNDIITDTYSYKFLTEKREGE